MLKTGLVSITFRQLSPFEIVQLVGNAGLHSIEWGGDVHVPHGDLQQAREVRRCTEDAGLVTAAYGSYYRAGDVNDCTFAQVLDTAVELCAPVIRIWAGAQGSKQADDEYRARVAADIRAASELAAASKVRVALEWHCNTLTDDTDSAVELFKAVNHANLRLYWQPPALWSEDELRTSLQRVAPLVENLHVFQWTTDGTRCPLSDGIRRWTPLFEIVQARATETDVFALIEFVRDDSAEQFVKDAQTLRQLVDS